MVYNTTCVRAYTRGVNLRSRYIQGTTDPETISRGFFLGERHDWPTWTPLFLDYFFSSSPSEHGVGSVRRHIRSLRSFSLGENVKTQRESVPQIFILFSRWSAAKLFSTGNDVPKNTDWRPSYGSRILPRMTRRILLNYAWVVIVRSNPPRGVCGKRCVRKY